MSSLTHEYSATVKALCTISLCKLCGGLHFSVQPIHACEKTRENAAHKECKELGLMSLFY